MRRYAMMRANPPAHVGVRVPLSKATHAIKKAILGSSILDLAGRLVPTRAVILYYHSIVEDPRLTQHLLGISQSRATFDAHMEIVARRYSPVTVEDIAHFAKSGRQLPRRAVAVTFDDGFLDNYEIALPILSRYGIPASFYIMVDAVETGSLPWYCRIRFAFNSTKEPNWCNPETKRMHSLGSPEPRNAARLEAWETAARMTGAVQEEFVMRAEEELKIEPVKRPPFMMNWDQVQAVRKAGHIIGAHTLSHPNVGQVTLAEARSEILGSKKKLEEKMGEEISHFSYPHPALNPQWSKDTLAITREAGFKSAVLTTRGSVRAGDDPLALKRIYSSNEPEQFMWNLQTTFLGRSL